MKTMKSYFFAAFHYKICWKTKIEKNEMENLYIFILSTIGFKIYSLLLKDCFYCFTEEIKAVFKGKRTAGEWH